MGFEVPIERGKIREFARATQSTNPAFQGEQALVPPTFLTTARLSWEPPHDNVVPGLGFDSARVLHAEEEYTFTGPPPHAGDLLTASEEVVDRYEKQGRRGGTLRFAIVRTQFTNHAGEVVAEQRTTLVETGQPAGRDA